MARSMFVMAFRLFGMVALWAVTRRGAKPAAFYQAKMDKAALALLGIAVRVYLRGEK